MPDAPAPRGLPLHTKMLIGLVIGATAGLVTHAALVTDARTRVVEAGPEGRLRLEAPAEVVTPLAERLEEERARPEEDRAPVRVLVEGTSLELVEATGGGLVVVVPPSQAKAPVAALVAGGEAHLQVESPAIALVVDNVANPIGQLFLRLIFMVVVPLVVSSLILGVVELGDVRTLGRIGLKTLVYTVAVSAISVVIGVGLVNVVRPGAWVAPGVRARLAADFGAQAATQKAIDNARAAKPWTESLLSLVPKNPLESASQALTGEMLALMVFALIFGIALARVRDAETEPLVGVLRGLQRASMQVVAWAMLLAPFAVAAFLFSLTAKTGLDVFTWLGAYVAVVIVGLLLHGVGVYSAILWFLARVSPREWFKRCREVVLTAFSTASSNATLPTALRTSAERLGVPEKVGNFVLTVGATGNQNGTALFEGVTVLFLAQVFGVELSLPQQLTVVVMSILAGIGTAGVPGGSLPLIVIVMQSVGVPAESIAIILGVDRLLDMCRTVVNVVGDLVCATYVARSEGVLAFEAPGPTPS